MNESLFAQLVAIGAARNIEVTYEDVPGQPGRKRLGYVLTIGTYEKYGYYLRPVTDEVLIDLIAYFENVEEPMNIYSTDLFTYMAGDMIGQSQIVLTIADVTMENMNSGKGGQQTKPCLRFKERSKLMVLNKTNAKTLAGILGPETENWKGARVTIAAPVVDAFGKSARSLRITDVQPPAQIPVKTRGGKQADWRDTAPTYADGSPVSPAAQDGYREYLAAHDGQPPADVRALIAWREGDEDEVQQDDLFGDGDPAATQAALATAQGQLD